MGYKSGRKCAANCSQIKRQIMTGTLQTRGLSASLFSHQLHKERMPSRTNESCMTSVRLYDLISCETLLCYVFFLSIFVKDSRPPGQTKAASQPVKLCRFRVQADVHRPPDKIECLRHIENITPHYFIILNTFAVG